MKKHGEELKLLDKINTNLKIDAKRFGITNLQLIDLLDEYFREGGEKPPEKIVFKDLLKVVT